MAKVTFGANVYISTGHCFSNCGGLALAVSGVSGRVMGETEKAWEIHATTERGATIKFWLPKRAIVRASVYHGSTTVHCSLAQWFKPTGWTARAIEVATQHSVLAG